MPFTSALIPPPPLSDAWVDKDGIPTTDITTWFLINLLPAIALAPSVPSVGNAPLDVSGQTAALATTPLPVGSVSAGMYRVSVFVRVTTADGVSSSVQPYVQFINDGVTCTDTGTALTANSVTQPKGYTFIVESDAPGPVSVGTNYASNTPNAMAYKLVATIERVQ